MKKVHVFFVLALLLTISKSFSQSTAPADFWAGKWEVQVTGTPQGDSKLTMNLLRKDGKLTGELSSPADANGGTIPITKIEETADKVVVYFSAQGFDVNVDLSKVDDNNLKGQMMGMFDAKAVRVK